MTGLYFFLLPLHGHKMVGYGRDIFVLLHDKLFGNNLRIFDRPVSMGVARNGVRRVF